MMNQCVFASARTADGTARRSGHVASGNDQSRFGGQGHQDKACRVPFRQALTVCAWRDMVWIGLVRRGGSRQGNAV